MNRGLEDCDRALLAKLEVSVRSDREGLEITCVRNGRIVVRTCAGASDVVPARIYVHGFTEVDGDAGIMRHGVTVGRWIGSRNPRS